MQQEAFEDMKSALCAKLLAQSFSLQIEVTITTDAFKTETMSSKKTIYLQTDHMSIKCLLAPDEENLKDSIE